MDLSSRDRTAADVAALPARESGVPLAGPPPGPHEALDSRLTRTVLGLVAFAAVGYLANRIKLAEGIHAHDSRHAIYPVARVAAAAAGLFAVAGFGAVRLLLPAT